MGYPVIAGGLIPAALSLNFLSGAMDPRISFTRASTATYTDITGTIQTAAINVPRFDFDPVTHAPRGLLVEAVRTNSLLNSGAPATQTTASLGVGQYTLWMDGTGSATTSAGTATITGGGTASSGVVNTFSVTVAGTVTVTVTGSPTRFQLENGAGRTSYIPTVGSTVTRAADVANLTLGGWFNAAAFTVIARWVFGYVPPETAGAQGPWGLDDGTLNNLIQEYTQTGVSNMGTFVVSGGVTGVNNAAVTATTAGAVTKRGMALQVGDFASYSGGIQRGTQSGGVVMPIGLTTLRIGAVPPSQWQLDGWVQGIDIYPVRLPNGTLAALTT